MRFTRLILLASAGILSVSAGTASAAIVTYTIAGTGTGTLAGTAFTNAAFTFTLTGDTALLASNIIDPLASATVTIAGRGTSTFLLATRLGSSGTVTFFSRSSSIGGSDLFDFNTTAPVNLGASFGPVTGTGIFALEQFVNVATSGGLLTFTQSSSVQFAGGPAVTPAVPEPASWALMIGGFGMVGGSLRRSRAALA